MRLLIIKIGDIGDVVCAIPMALEAKSQGAKITWVVARTAKPVLERVGFIDEIVEVEGFEKRYLPSVLQAWKKIAFRSFDLVVTPYCDPRYHLFSLFTKGKRKCGFTKEVYRPEVYMRFLSDRPVVWPKFSEKKRTKIVLSVGENSKKNGRHLRAWPIRHYQKVEELLRRRGEMVIVTGVDAWAGQFFQGSLIGKQSLEELMDLLQEAKLVITHDCGTLHLAKLMGAETIELFGPTNPKIVGHGEAIVASPALSCQHCYDGKNYAKCARALCMERITPEMVMRRVDRYCS